MNNSDYSPYHVAICTEMGKINRGVKNAYPRAIQLLRLVATTKCPRKGLPALRINSEAMIGRLGGAKHKRFSTADRAIINKAALAIEHQERIAAAEERGESSSEQQDGERKDTDGSLRRAGYTPATL